jgi:hypothetical protein
MPWREDLRQRWGSESPVMPGSGNHWTDQHSSQYRDYAMMSAGDYEAKYGEDITEYQKRLNNITYDITIDFDALPENSQTTFLFGADQVTIVQAVDLGPANSPLLLNPNSFVTCNEPNCTHGLQKPVDLAGDWADWAGVALDASDDVMNDVGKNFKTLQAESNALRLGLNYGSEIGKVNATTLILKWTGRVVGVGNAYSIEQKFRNKQINRYQRNSDQIVNVISTFGGWRGAAIGIGWEIGRAITTTDFYQNWKRDTWVPWLQANFGD